MAKKNILTHAKKKKASDFVKIERFSEALKLLGEVCRIDRLDADAWFALGVVQGRLNDASASVASLRNSLALNPTNPLAHFNLGVILRAQGQFDEAVQSFRTVIHLAPKQVEAYSALGHTLISLGQLEGAAGSFRELIQLNPKDIESWVYLGRVCQLLGNLEEAIGCFRKVLEINPGYASVYDNLGSAFCDQGLHDEAVAAHFKSVQLAPLDALAHSNLLLTLQYLPDSNWQDILTAHRRWAETHAPGSAALRRYTNSRAPERCLRIGYVSPDFRMHSVAFFIAPLLARHDRTAVEIFCYANGAQQDTTTDRLRNLADHWRSICGVTDKQAGELIRADSIDILVDLAGHTAGSRLPLFGEKHAPIQVTYLGYPNTTGLAAIDYRLTDELADPIGQEPFYTEQLVRLPGCFLSYESLDGAPDVAPLPALENGFITFGSFNNLPKINGSVIEIWAKLLRMVPNARLFIKSPPLSDEGVRRRHYALFAEHGISHDRLELKGIVESQIEHLDLYRRIDIALDPFPYNGTTTTCEALWMGVPVVTLAGQRHSGRVGVSLLNAVGMRDWIATNADEYVSIAANRAATIPKLDELRASLRFAVATSPLCDGVSFARKVDAAYRQMWRDWCGLPIGKNQ